MLKDQYDRPIPTDLVVLDLRPDELTAEELARVDRADWYEARGILLVSYTAIDGLTECDPVDAGLDLLKEEILFVDRVLHRWGKRDGFYHA